MNVAGLRASSLLPSVREALAGKLSLRASAPSPSLSRAFTRPSQPGPPMSRLSHNCDVDAEPIHRYQSGGYHPVHLGDYLSDGRYKVLHKLGWGGYSTVWAARDMSDQTYVAVKIWVAEQSHQSREASILHTLAAAKSTHPGCQYLAKLQDSFSISGPNGTHECLVLDLLGPSVADFLDAHSNVERLPGKVAKRIVNQALLGLCLLHEQGIAHADMHARNLAFTIPTLKGLSEEAFLERLGEPETGLVQTSDNQPLRPGMPRYLVRPTCWPVDLRLSSTSIRIIDFGQSFLASECPVTVRTPLAVRAPEIIFRDKLDHRVDLWSMGCLFFELIVGQPLFDSFMTTPAILVRQMLGTTNDSLPDRWKADWLAMDDTPCIDSSACSLQDWLEEMYFDGERRVDLSREDIKKVGLLIGSLLRVEPSSRVSAKTVIQDEWF